MKKLVRICCLLFASICCFWLFSSQFANAEDPEKEARSVFVKIVNAAKTGNTEEFKKFLVKDDLQEMETEGALPLVMMMMADDNPDEYTADIKGNHIEFKKETKSSDGSMSTTVHMVKDSGQWKFGKPKD